MIPRVLLLLVLAPIALLPSGCASTEDATTDDSSTWQASPEKPDDSHGWGANVGNVSSGRN
jgi:hypothetical protein